MKCSVCGKDAYLDVYYDRFGIYSGKACSLKCSYKLPGRGVMWNYEPEEDTFEDGYNFDCEFEDEYISSKSVTSTRSTLDEVLTLLDKLSRSELEEVEEEIRRKWTQQ
ncbi:MAG: hypothetical protein ACK421_07690 [Pseudanabaenaceae cyanobacterium]